MIKIRIGDKYLDMGDSSITLSFHNPMFDDLGIDRAYSYTIKVPTSPRNIEILNHANRLDNPNVGDKYIASLYIDVMLIQGVIKITNITRKFFSLTFQNEILEKVDSLNKTSLRQLALPEINIGEHYYPDFSFKGGHHTSEMSDKYIRIAINGKWYEGLLATSDLIDAINVDYPGFATESFSIDTGGNYWKTIYLTNNKRWASPQIRINKNTNPDTVLLNPIYISCNNGNIVHNNTDIQAAWTTHLSSIRNNPDTHVFPTIHAPKLYPLKNGLYKALNYTDESGNYKLNPAEEYTYDPDPTDQNPGKKVPAWRYALSPQVFIKTILGSVAAYIDQLELGGDFLDSDTEKLILFSNRLLDFSFHPYHYIYDVHQNKWCQNAWKCDYNLADHMPDVPIADFLISLRKMFFIYFKIDAGELVVSKIKPRLTGPIEDWTKISDENFQKENENKNGYRLDYDRPSEDNSIDLPAKKEAGEELEWITDIYPLHNKIVSDPDITDRYRLMPEWEEEGNSDYYPSDILKKMKLLIYHGWQKDNQGNLYPLASNSDQDYGGNIVSNISLKWEGENGLFNKYGKEFIALLTNGKRVVKTIRLTLAQIIELRRFEHVRKMIIHESGQMVGIVESFQITVPVSSQLNKKSGIITKVTFITQ